MEATILLSPTKNGWRKAVFMLDGERLGCAALLPDGQWRVFNTSRMFVTPEEVGSELAHAVITEAYKHAEHLSALLTKYSKIVEGQAPWRILSLQ